MENAPILYRIFIDWRVRLAIMTVPPLVACILFYTTSGLVKADIPPIQGEISWDKNYLYFVQKQNTTIERYDIIPNDIQGEFFRLIDRGTGSVNKIEFCIKDTGSSFWDDLFGQKRRIPTHVNLTFEFNDGESKSIGQYGKFCRDISERLYYMLTVKSNITIEEQNNSRPTFVTSIEYSGGPKLTWSILVNMLLLYVGWIALILIINEARRFVLYQYTLKTSHM